MLKPDAIIHDPEDLRVREFSKLRDKDLKRIGEHFIIEGRVSLQTILNHGIITLDAILLSHNQWQSFSALESNIPDSCELWVTKQEILNAIAGFPIHRGVLALARRPKTISLKTLLQKPLIAPSRFLILAGLTNTENVGACFRNAAAFGFDAVILDPYCADPLYRRALKVSSGLSACLPFSRASSWDEICNIAAIHHLELVALSTEPCAKAVGPWLQELPHLGFVIGPEGAGLSTQVLDTLKYHATIPMTPAVDSLNAATAAAIAMHYSAKIHTTPASDLTRT